jgi:hypothetical protein
VEAVSERLWRTLSDVLLLTVLGLLVLSAALDFPPWANVAVLALAIVGVLERAAHIGTKLRRHRRPPA